MVKLKAPSPTASSSFQRPTISVTLCKGMGGPAVKPSPVSFLNRSSAFASACASSVLNGWRVRTRRLHGVQTGSRRWSCCRILVDRSIIASAMLLEHLRKLVQVFHALGVDWARERRGRQHAGARSRIASRRERRSGYGLTHLRNRYVGWAHAQTCAKFLP